MAKTKMKSTIQDYEELDKQFRKLAEVTAKLKIKEAEMNKEILDIQKKYDEKLKVTSELKNGLALNIQLFCEEHYKEFEVKPSRKYLVGSLGFSKSSKGKIEILKKAKEGFKAAAVAIQSIFDDKYVRMVPELEKDKLAADYRAKIVTDTQLAACNLVYKNEPVFFYKIDFKKVEELTGLKIPAEKNAA